MKKPRLLPIEKRLVAMLPRVLHTQLFTKDDVRVLCQWVARDLDTEGGLYAHFTGEHQAQMDLLNCKLGQGEMSITFEHENEGIAWLWANRQKVKLGGHEIATLRRVEHIAFVGVDPKRLGLRWYTAPIYRVYQAEPATYVSFTYAAWSWQSGVTPYLL
jgi:hypothetical protein